MLDLEISNLLVYAQNNLFMDELDCSQAARRICGMLKITDFAPVEPSEDVELAANPNKLVEPLLAYAVEHGLVTADKTPALKAEIM
ncbi:MAG: hypothetical protein OSJ83_12895, partial [Clostridia bacterium]|nr:hypothetical protein [Clostridia bacterium]